LCSKQVQTEEEEDEKEDSHLTNRKICQTLRQEGKKTSGILNEIYSKCKRKRN